ncbi:hypothetical protein ZWY2020_049892 [Hordeum vulgare]|nr:hypothetical protein ZWY2020_049892 [Hordeum vulgare]
MASSPPGPRTSRASSASPDPPSKQPPQEPPSEAPSVPVIDLVALTARPRSRPGAGQRRSGASSRAVKYHCNFDLHQSGVANWRDTLYLRMAPEPPLAADLPEPCRDALFEYAEQGQIMLCHYFPVPGARGGYRYQPALRLQLPHRTAPGPSRWPAGPPRGPVGRRRPAPGALVVNVGDLLQLVSNDGLRSVEHRVVLAKVAKEARVSIACFFSTHFHPASTRAYGPIRELVSEDRPALYRETLVRDYVKHYYAIGLDAKTALSVFRL